MKEVKHIEVPKEWESENDWDSHRGLLYLALKNSGDKIWELGCGFGSTPLIQKYCEENGKWFGSIDENKEWAAKFSCTQYLQYEKIEQYLPCSLLFVDCAPGELRKHLIGKYKDRCDVIVVHDTEPGAEYVYGMSEILSTFKYRLDYQPEGKPHTTAVSNLVNILN